MAIRAPRLLLGPLRAAPAQRIMTAPPAKQDEKKDIGDMRKVYRAPYESLEEADLGSADPTQLFDAWFQKAKAEAESFEEANTMMLATATKDGAPSCRPVLLKAFGPDGFQFYTSYDSRKAGELAENPRAALCVYFARANRTVRVEGSVERLPEGDARAYWDRRPPDSQASAAASTQSRPITDKAALRDNANRILRLATEQGKPIPKPDFWMAEKTEDLNLPLSVVSRIIKESLPTGVLVSKEARVAISRAASVFVLHATTYANQVATAHKRKTLTAPDILAGVKELELDDFLEPLQLALDTWKEAQKRKLDAKKAGKALPDDEAPEDDGEGEDEDAQPSPEKNSLKPPQLREQDGEEDDEDEDQEGSTLAPDDGDSDEDE